MARRFGSMQRTPGMTPIDSPAPYEPGKYDVDDENGRLEIQEEEDDESEGQSPRAKRGSAQKTPDSKPTKP
jgi:hypothetical protein